ncbi:MAG: hypothetical protein A3J38_04585 [Gammaproteobacteria bacterium RIFCSPHIGHO2_12_FULL_45_9]|nr:MAG: hypothetical protein A3J38_04585 [Gammaproteobacteria bacterium RIFCSPHIGHO2_12_FULL_45_9]
MFTRTCMVDPVKLNDALTTKDFGTARCLLGQMADNAVVALCAESIEDITKMMNNADTLESEDREHLQACLLFWEEVKQQYEHQAAQPRPQLQGR